MYSKGRFDSLAVGERLSQRGRREQIPISEATWFQEKETAGSLLTMRVLQRPAGGFPHAQRSTCAPFMRIPTHPDGTSLGEGKTTPPSPPAAHALRALSHVHIVLLPQVSRQRPASAPPPWFFFQPLQSFLQKSLYPLVSMATAHAN